MTPAPASRDCPVCGRNEAEAYLQKGELRLVRCRQCTMIYANPVPAEFASGEYYDRAGTDYYLSPAKLESDYAAVRFERELRLFRKHCQGGAVLDVGCSSGAFLFQLNQRFPGCYQVLGTDVSGPPLDYAESRGVAVVRGNFLEQDFGGRQFDAVTFWAVLEHLVEPQQFLTKAASVLKPDGLCFVLVPNMKSLAARVFGARYRYIYPQHLNYFTKATLTKLVEAHFSVIAVQLHPLQPDCDLAGLARRRQGSLQSRARPTLAAHHFLQTEPIAEAGEGPLRARRKDARRAEPRGQSGGGAAEESVEQ